MFAVALAMQAVCVTAARAESSKALAGARYCLNIQHPAGLMSTEASICNSVPVLHHLSTSSGTHAQGCTPED